MAELYSIKEKRIVSVPDSEVEEKIRSEAFDFLGGPNSRIAINQGQGPTYVPAHTASKYIRTGASYMTPLAIEAARDNKEFAESALGGVAAIGTGLDEYLFAGAGGHALEALGVADEGSVEAISAQSPWIHHGSGIAGSILAALGTFGGSTEGQAALHAGKAATKLGVAATQNTAKAASIAAAKKSITQKGYDAATTGLASATLPGIGAAVGRAVEGKAHSALMKYGDSFVPYKIANSEIAKRWGPSVAKATAASIGAGVEGAVWGTGVGISESIIGEPEESAEFLLDSITDNVLIGMAFGGAVGGLTPFLAGAGGAAANMADTMLDVSGRAGGVALKKAAPHIARIAKNNGYDPEVVKWLKKVIETGDVEAIKDLDTFVNTLGDTSADLAKFFDSLVVTEEFRQISDIQGLNLEALMDAVDATIQRKGIHHDIGKVFDADSALSNLKEQLGEDTLALDMFRTSKKKPHWVEGLSEEQWRDRVAGVRKEIKDRESYLRKNSRTPTLGEDNLIPETSQIVLNNASESFASVRLALISAKESAPSSNAQGAISSLLDKVNDAEAKLYRDLFSEDNYDRLRAQYAVDIRASRSTKADKHYIDNLEKAFEPAGGLSPSKIDILGKKLESHFLSLGVEAKDLVYSINDLKYALNVFKDTGDRKAIDAFLRNINATDDLAGGDGARSLVDKFLPKAITNRAMSAKYAEAIRKRSSFDGTTAKWDDLSDSFAGIRENIDEAVDHIKGDNTYFTPRKAGDVDLAAENSTAYARDGILGFTEKGGSSLRSVIDEIMLKLDNQTHDTEIAARAFKALEEIQTDALKAIQYGVIPDTPGVSGPIQDEIIDMLRQDMKREDKWGQMASMKKEFDNRADQFQALKDQIEGELGTSVGREMLGDPTAFRNFIDGLSQKNFMKLNRLTEYGEAGRSLLDFIRRNFDEIIPENLPPQLKSTIKDRLKKIDEAGLKMGTTLVDAPGLSWDDRLASMSKFSGEASDSLKTRIDDIKEQLPIVEALQSVSGRDSNMSNLISDVGRGGIASTLAFATTGSPMVSAAVGLAVGGASMALSPQRVLNLIRQLSVLKKSQKEAIADYMSDWAENKIPKAAITKGWEKTSRSMLMIASQPVQGDRDQKKTRSAIRKKAAQSRDKAHWSSKINEALNSEITEENYFDVKISINKLAGSPFLMKSFTEELTKIFEKTPDIRKSMMSIIERKINIANKIIPKASLGTAFSDPLPPSDFQLKEFGRQLQILNSPSDTILTAMLSGTLTPKMVNTFMEAWPILYKETAQAALEAISKIDRADLTSGQKMALSTLLKTPIMGAKEFERLSASYAEEEKPQQRPQGGGNDMSSLTGAPGIGTTQGTLNN